MSPEVSHGVSLSEDGRTVRFQIIRGKQVLWDDLDKAAVNMLIDVLTEMREQMVDRE
jgi:hypothetical protein